MTDKESITPVKPAVCASCGSDIRPGSQFCFNCGGSLEAISTSGQIASKDSYVPPASPTNGVPTSDLPIVKGPGLRSAASLRKEARSFRREPVEIAWEANGGSSDAIFILGALILTLFAVGAVALALYWK